MDALECLLVKQHKPENAAAIPLFFLNFFKESGQPKHRHPTPRPEIKQAKSGRLWVGASRLFSFSGSPWQRLAGESWWSTPGSASQQCSHAARVKMLGELWSKRFGNCLPRVLISPSLAQTRICSTQTTKGVKEFYFIIFFTRSQGFTW